MIIIGSGLGGLSCGLILSRNGYDVTVLEQGTQVGGCLQCFSRHGVKFETGMHFIGSADEGQVLNRLLRYLDIYDDIRLSRLDPKGYDVNYSEGGDLWLISKGGERGLEVQMDAGKVYSIEIRFPEYCVAKYAYESAPGKQQPYVGASINDCLTFGSEAPQVWMLMDGTVQIEDGIWNSKIAFRTSRESLVNPPEPSFDGRVRISSPQFKPDATIESILIWRE